MLHLVIGMVCAATAAADWCVLDYGAVGDGAADCTEAFQQALDAAGEAGGGIVRIPAGIYRIDGTLRIPAAVTLEGVFRAPARGWRQGGEAGEGTSLYAFAGRGAPDSAPFITLAGEAATIKGVTIGYPEISTEDVPPIPYPPTIYSHGTENVSVQDVCLMPCYEGIHFDTAHRHLVRNVYGYPLMRGLYVDSCMDIGRVENVHYWPFGVVYKPDDPFCKWVNVNGVAFEFARTDWQYVTNTFCFGYGVGYKFSESDKGACNGNFLGIGADSCQRAVLVEQCQLAGLLITNGEFVGRWSSTDSVCVEIAESVSGGKVSLNNCSFWGPIDRCIWMRSEAAQVTANACHFCNWDFSFTGRPAVEIDAGKAIIQGCTFLDGDTHVAVGPAVRSAILTANQAEGGFRFKNQAGARTQAALNEEFTVAWPDGAANAYAIDIGAAGDRAYLTRWYGREKGQDPDDPASTMRWATVGSRFLLPVTPGVAYNVTVHVGIPEHAVDAAAGLYLGDERIAAFPETAGPAVVTGVIPATDASEVALELRALSWRPCDVMPGNGDSRTLTVNCSRIEMRAADAPEDAPLFDANSAASAQ